MKKKKGFGTLWAILGVVVLILIIGMIWYYKTYHSSNTISQASQSASTTEASNQSSTTIDIPTIIYGIANYNNSGMVIQDIDFYSIKADGTDQQKLFSLNADQLIDPSGIPDLSLQFSKTSEAMYFQPTAIGCSDFIKVDSAGDVQNLQFAGVNGRCSDLSLYQFAGFAISPDGSKIIWSNIYKPPSSFVPTSEIYIANTDGSGQKLLLSTQETTTTLAKGIFQWSQEDPNLVYLSNYSWTGSNASFGDTSEDGLSTLNITTGQVEPISQIPGTDQVFAISPDGTKVIHSLDYTLGGHTITSMTNLTDNTVSTFNDGSNGKILFSPAGDMVADVLPQCSGHEAQAQCVDNLYVYKGSQNYEVASSTALLGWLSDNSILGEQADAIVSVDVKSGQVATITPIQDAQGNFLFVGIE